MSECTDERFVEKLLAYELGLLSDDERQQIEIHILECPDCFRKVQRFQAMGELMRDDPEARECIRQIAEGRIAQEDTPTTPDSRRRWRLPAYGYLVAATAVAVILLLLIPWQFEIRPTQDVVAAENKLLVMSFDNRFDDTRLGDIIANLLITDLSESQFVRVISPERLHDVRKLIQQRNLPKDSSDLAKLTAEYAGARWILRGDVIRDQQTTAITSRLVEFPGMEVVATQKVTGRSDEPVFSLVDRLSAEIKNDLSLPASAVDEVDPRVADITTHFPEAYLHYLEGEDFTQKLYYTEAVKAFKSCLAIDSSYAMAYYYLAALECRELIKNALEHIDHASRKDKYLIKSRAADYLENRVGHKKILEELLHLYPSEKEALLTLGRYAHEEGNYNEAISRLTAALAIDPLYKSAYNQLSYTYDANGEHDKAVETINKYISIAPNEANPYDSRGDLYARNGFLEEAIASYRTALAKKPDFSISKANLGHMYLFQGKYAEAAKIYTDVVESVDAPYQTLYPLYRAFVPLHQGKLSEALDIIDQSIIGYENAVGRNPSLTFALPHFVKYWIHLEKNQIDKAVEDAEACIRLSDMARPGNTVFYRWPLAYSLDKAGEHYRADSILHVISEYYRHNPSEPPVAYYWSTGMIALARDDGITAVSMMESAVEGYTPATKFMGFSRLGEAYLEAERYEEAVNTLEQTVNVVWHGRLLDGVYGVKVHYYLGRAYEGAGKDELAVDQYTKFLEFWKNADPDLVVVFDAQRRLAKLQSAP
jgi:tetratricopeptide (TPR) repeat protein